MPPQAVVWLRWHVVCLLPCTSLKIPYSQVGTPSAVFSLLVPSRVVRYLARQSGRIEQIPNWFTRPRACAAWALVIACGSIFEDDTGFPLSWTHHFEEGGDAQQCGRIRVPVAADCQLVEAVRRDDAEVHYVLRMPPTCRVWRISPVPGHRHAELKRCRCLFDCYLVCAPPLRRRRHKKVRDLPLCSATRGGAMSLVMVVGIAPKTSLAELTSAYLH